MRAGRCRIAEPILDAERAVVGFLFVLIVGLIAGTVSGIVGTGSSIMLMPVLVYEYGPKQAVPIMAVAAVMANFSRILAWWREVDWRACAAYSVTGIPAAALGARTLLALPSHAVDIAIGLFLIAMVPVRHWLARHQLKAKLWHLSVGGALIGYLTGIVVSTGPLSVPLFLFYGLTKGDAGRVPERPDRRLLADGRRLHRQAFCAASRAQCVPAVDGRHHARGRRFAAVVGGIFIKFHRYRRPGLNQPQRLADEGARVTSNS